MSACRDVRELAPDFALGVLDGSERASVVEHLATCAECRRYVDDLAAAADALLVLAPEAEPPAGFESRVLAALPGAKRASRARWIAAVAAAAVLAAGATWLGAARAFRADRETRAAFAELGGTELRAASFHAPSDAFERRGRAVAYEGRPSWVFLWIGPGHETRDDTYQVAFDFDGGTTRVVASGVRVGPEGGTWGSVVRDDVRSLRAIRMLDDDGSVAYVARFDR